MDGPWPQAREATRLTRREFHVRVGAGLAAALVWPAGNLEAANEASSRLVQPGAGGRLAYRPYTKLGDTIPDFSTCGYRGGGARLPEIPVRTTLAPDARGGDDTARIQAAIDLVSARSPDLQGFRGAVLLKKGRYRVGQTLQLHASGVVLRGEGQGADGTVLVATRRAPYTLIAVHGSNAAESSRPLAIQEDYVPVGARSFTVTDPSSLKVGAPVVVHRPSTAVWIHALGMDRIPAKKDTVQWAPGTFDLRFERVIASIQGRRVTVDAPLANALQREYGGGTLYACRFANRVQESGVEQLRGESLYANPEDEQHGWVMISINDAQNVWVRGVTSRYFGYSCVQIGSRAKWVTVQDCACLDPMSQTTGGRKYSFGIGGHLCLVQRCRTRGGRHDYVMSARVAGPNVFLNCVADDAQSDSGPHHRWATGTLYDNVVVHGNELNVQDRGNSGSGHGWSGAQMVFWNCTARRITCQQPPTAQNFAIGCRGDKAPGWNPRPDGWWESPGKPVAPASLYLRQLADRLGASALRNIEGPGPAAG